MPYENYLSEAEFQAGCHFWPRVEEYLNREFAPNPWVFLSGCKVLPQAFRYVLTYQSFDGAQKLVLTAEMVGDIVEICSKVTQSRG